MRTAMLGAVMLVTLNAVAMPGVANPLEQEPLPGVTVPPELAGVAECLAQARNLDEARQCKYGALACIRAVEGTYSLTSTSIPLLRQRDWVAVYTVTSYNLDTGDLYFPGFYVVRLSTQMDC